MVDVRLWGDGMDAMTMAYEQAAKNSGFSVVCGVDEAGRGPLCGPVCAAAVILPDGCVIEGLNDSKKLSEKKREQLFDVVKETAVSYGVGMATAKEIDEINILQATFLAMRRAVAQLCPQPDLALIDGNQKPGLPCAEETIVKGDAKCMSVAAASILAKVTRDRYMRELDKRYPQYCFAQHKGYGTKLHYEKLAEYGLCEEHRRTFLKKILGEPNEKKETGDRGEDVCARYYEKHGYTVIARNFHSRYGEIDVIAESDTQLVFIEVKTRAEGQATLPCEAVDQKKMRRLTQTAQMFLTQYDKERQMQFDVFEVLTRDGRPVKCRRLENAFDESCPDM
ncbi:MAG: ribonuclease HII [Clostridia bacterium]|nr:ribonuclease HII [Clostridia bacterium]